MKLSSVSALSAQLSSVSALSAQQSSVSALSTQLSSVNALSAQYPPSAHYPLNYFSVPTIHRQCNRPTRWSNFAPIYPPPALPPQIQRTTKQHYKLTGGIKLAVAAIFILLSPLSGLRTLHRWQGKSPSACILLQIQMTLVTNSGPISSQMELWWGGGWREQSGPVYWSGYDVTATYEWSSARPPS